MLVVEVARGPDGRVVGLRASGHAGFAPRGRDIVCAGASALLHAAALAASRYLGRAASVRARGAHLEVSIDAGRMQEAAVPGDGPGYEDRIRAQGALEAAVWGVEEMARQYPSHVRLVDQGAGGSARREGGAVDPESGGDREDDGET